MLPFFKFRPRPPKQSIVASLGSRLHTLGHHNVTIELKTPLAHPSGSLHLSPVKTWIFAVLSPMEVLAKMADARCMKNRAIG